ncbi:MAG: DMT family transporter [Clostridiaceae bacterium]|nr:DMT family transporter [Clostridiaceae bacterium]
MFGMIVSIISGVLMSLQGVFNTQVTKQTSIWVSASFVQATALIVCLAAWLITERDSSFSGLFQVRPWYMLLGGVMGAFITYTVIFGMEKLGPAKAVLFIIAAQLIAAYLVELFGWFGSKKAGFDWMKLVGVIIFIAGIVLFKWKELFKNV